MLTKGYDAEKVRSTKITSRALRFPSSRKSSEFSLKVSYVQGITLDGKSSMQVNLLQNLFWLTHPLLKMPNIGCLRSVLGSGTPKTSLCTCVHTQGVAPYTCFHLLSHFGC